MRQRHKDLRQIKEHRDSEQHKKQVQVYKNNSRICTILLVSISAIFIMNCDTIMSNLVLISTSASTSTNICSTSTTICSTSTPTNHLRPTEARRSKHHVTSSFKKSTYPFPTKITSYDQLERLKSDVPVPRNLNIVFVGDSVTRYQYSSLVYFLKFGKWINMHHPIPIAANETINRMYQQEIAKELVPHQSLIWKNFWNGKDDWSQFSTSLLSPFEMCDYFEPSNINYKDFGKDSMENRYFREPAQNNTITYFQKYGDLNNWKKP